MFVITVSLALSPRLKQHTARPADENCTSARDAGILARSGGTVAGWSFPAVSLSSRVRLLGTVGGHEHRFIEEPISRKIYHITKRIGHMAREYKAVSEYEETGRNEILFEREPIPHIPYTPSSQDDFTWGYGGAGPTNVGRSILEHAVDMAAEEINENPVSYQDGFTGEYISPRDNTGDGWTIEHAEVINYLETQEPDNPDGHQG